MKIHISKGARRAAVFFIVVPAACVLIIALAFTWFVRRPFPKVGGRIEAAGLSAPVEVFRDEDGVPHIWASTAGDLYFAQGWVHAQDRAWQMEFQRRLGGGRLSEILGEKLIETDRYIRTLGIPRIARAEYEAMSRPYKDRLESYAAGVSAYFASRPPSRLGLEFAVFRLTGVKWDVEPWKPEDSILWSKMVTMNLSVNAVEDRHRMNLLRVLGGKLKDVWYAPYRADMPVTVSAAELDAFRKTLGIPGTEPAAAAAARGTAPDALRLLGGGEGVGTNLWALSPGRAGGGRALLINDMHLAVQIPSIWHEIGLHVVPAAGSGEEPMNLRGYQFPGMPGITSGQNGWIAWGQSVLYGDVQDYFIEEIHPDDPNLYRAGAGWERMTVVRETIHVKGRQNPVVHQVRTTRHGPVISDLKNFSGLGSLVYEDRPAFTELALAWPALNPGSLAEAILRLNGARNFPDSSEALSRWDAPSINFVYADAQGNIGYQAVGRHPLRPAPQAQAPAPGWDERKEWKGDIPFDRLPGSLNPPKGYVVSCNNAVVGPEYPYYIGAEFASGFRARRIGELIESEPGGLSLEGVKSVFMDTSSLQAKEALEYFRTIDPEGAYGSWLERKNAWRKDLEKPSAKDLRRKEKNEAEELKLVTEASRILREWDMNVEADSAGAAAFGFVWKQLIIETFADEIPDHFWPVGTGTLENAIHYLLAQPESIVWDDKRTPGIRENRDDILAHALAGGLLDARKDLGGKPGEWTWGKVHTVKFVNATLGKSGIGPIEKMFNRGPYPIRGGNSQVHKTNWVIEKPFETTVIPSQRVIYDPADPSKSLFMNTVGQSGHPYHRHYDDLIEPYLEGKFHPSRWTREEAEASAGRRRLVLSPPGG